MKLSNKILLGFFGAIYIYMFAAFAEIRFKGDYNRFTPEHKKVEQIPLENVKYLIVNDLNKRLYVKTADTSRIELASKEGNNISRLKYELRGDTLILNDLDEKEGEHFHLNLFIQKDQLKWINANYASVHISGLIQDNFTVMQKGGKLALDDVAELNRLNLHAMDDAEFDAYEVDVETISLNMSNANVEIRSAVDRLEGDMANESWLSIVGVQDFDFKKDKSSRMRHTN